MPPVLLLHAPAPPFEIRRTVGLLHEKLDGVTAMDVRPHRLREIRTATADGALLHAFGGRALAAALLVTKGEIFYTAERFPNQRAIAWLRAALRYRSIRIVCASDTERRAWVTGGVPIDRCVLIRPGVSMATPSDARAAARTRFGYSDADRVLFTPTPVQGWGRNGAVWGGCLANMMDASIRSLIWTEARFDTLAALQTRQTRPEMMTILDDETPAAGFAAADVILLPPADTVSPTLVAMAMASGRPIVSTASPTVCEMLEDRHTALLANGVNSRVLASRIEDVFADADLARQVADKARAEAYEFFLLSRMVGDYRAVYAKSGLAADQVIAQV